MGDLTATIRTNELQQTTLPPPATTRRLTKQILCNWGSRERQPASRLEWPAGFFVWWFRTVMSDLYLAASRFWLLYLDRGPGAMQSIDLREFERAKTEFSLRKSDDLNQIANVVEELECIFRRCTDRSEGLCFVTGEAGLIPNRNLHDRCEWLLERLRTFKQVDDQPNA